MKWITEGHHIGNHLYLLVGGDLSQRVDWKLSPKSQSTCHYTKDQSSVPENSFHCWCWAHQVKSTHSQHMNIASQQLQGTFIDVECVVREMFCTNILKLNQIEFLNKVFQVLHSMTKILTDCREKSKTNWSFQVMDLERIQKKMFNLPWNTR